MENQIQRFSKENILLPCHNPNPFLQKNLTELLSLMIFQYYPFISLNAFFFAKDTFFGITIANLILPQ